VGQFEVGQAVTEPSAVAPDARVKFSLSGLPRGVRSTSPFNSQTKLILGSGATALGCVPAWPTSNSCTTQTHHG
jgi:hypothetical protein